MKKSISLVLIVMMMLSMLTIVQAADFSGSGYNFVCADGGRYLNVYAGKDADGTNVCVWEKDGSPEQNYTISACGGGKYKLHPACSSSRVIDVNRGNSYNNPLKAGLNVDLWRTNDAPAQEFYITHVGNNLYKIELAALSGHVLQANSPNKNNGNVTLERYTGASNQHWKILKNGTQVTEPCTHKNISNKNEKSTTEQKNDDMHTVIKTYDKVCNDCGKTIESNVKETKTEKHNIVKNKCKSCGYEVLVVEEKCNHSNTKENWQSSTVSQKDDTYHTVEEIYDVLCTDCGETLKKLQNKTYDEKHSLKDDECEKCSYVVPGSEASICKHKNTAKHSSDDMKTTISIKDDNQHTIASYYHVWCTDCFTYIKENELDLVNEDHKFVNNICSVCNLEKFVEKTAYVYNTDGDNLNMRSQANSSSSILVKIPAGASLTVTGDIINGFYPVKYNGKTGYASTAYITFTKPSVNKTAYVYNTDGANLNMRSGANKNASIVTKMPEGCTLTVTGDATNGFYPVKYGNHSGYASTAYITFTKPSTTAAALNSTTIISNSKTDQKKSQLTSMMNGSSHSGTYKIDKKYTGPYSNEQCKGFAKSVFMQLFGYNIGSTTNGGYGYQINYSSSKTTHLGSLTSLTTTNVKNLFSKARPGDFVQMNQKGSYSGPHSAIVYEVSASGVTFYECNLDWKNTITKNYYSWQQIVSGKSAISVYTAKGY